MYTIILQLITLIAASIMIAVITKCWLNVLWFYAVFIVMEMMYIHFGKSPFQSKDLTSIFYDLSVPVTEWFGEIGLNFSEGIYPNDDYSISPSEAEKYKFDTIFDLLNVEAGDIILDLGCGTCSFEKYCQERDVHVVGLSVSNQQIYECKRHGIEAYVWNMYEFNPKLEERFDHIIMMGSTEHLESGPMTLVESYIVKQKKMENLLNVCKRYFKPNSEKKNIFYSGLHANLAYQNDMNWIIIQRAYGGTLLLNTAENSIFACAENTKYHVTSRRDTTKEYFLATYLDPNHFGNAAPVYSKYMIVLFLIGIIYPFAWYIWFYYIFGLWMWMFDGKYHTYTNKRYTLGQDSSQRPVTLWWAVLSLHES